MLMSTTTSKRIIAAIVMAVAVFASACGGSSSAGDLPPADSLPDLEFGRGEMPITVPENWPMPSQYSIGATMSDGTRVLTEVSYTTGGNIEPMVQFYEAALPDADYEIETTKLSEAETDIAFEGNGIEGNLILKQLAPGVTGATLRFTYSS
jgi:hypothetical protein